jgi:hypothetical protein
MRPLTISIRHILLCIAHNMGLGHPLWTKTPPMKNRYEESGEQLPLAHNGESQAYNIATMNASMTDKAVVGPLI